MNGPEREKKPIKTKLENQRMIKKMLHRKPTQGSSSVIRIGMLTGLLRDERMMIGHKAMVTRKTDRIEDRSMETARDEASEIMVYRTEVEMYKVE